MGARSSDSQSITASPRPVPGWQKMVCQPQVSVSQSLIVGPERGRHGGGQREYGRVPTGCLPWRQQRVMIR